MVTGRGGMGSHKHGVSGHSQRSPRFKLKTLLEQRKNEEEQRNKPKEKRFSTVAEILENDRNKK